MDNPYITPELYGNRIILKPISSNFCNEKYLSWLNDPDVYAHLDSGGNYTMQDLHNFVNKNVKEGILFWAIVLKEENKHIGNIKIDKINKIELHGEYGIMVGEKNLWGKGYAGEASKIVIDYCFKTIGLKAIRLGVNCKNISALNLYKKIGFDIVSNESSISINGHKDNFYRMVLLKEKFCE